MWRSGDIETTVCPSRLLAEAPWCEELIDWWTFSARWTPSGMGAPVPIGVSEWPFPGGVRRQPNRLVEAVNVLQAEWSKLHAPENPKGVAPEPTKADPEESEHGD